MLWAASCMCFFGFLRLGEVVASSTRSFDPSVHLCYGDARVDGKNPPHYLEVRLKASKTDPYCKAVSVYLGVAGSEFCPVAAILNFMVRRGATPGPFFTFSDGRYLTRDNFVSNLQRVLQAAGLDSRMFAGHSFRKGAATTVVYRTL